MATPPPEILSATTPANREQRLRMSYEEYLAWANEDVLAEWVNGEILSQFFICSRFWGEST
jgi:hypothetical protein